MIRAHALFSSSSFAIFASRFARFVSSQNAPPVENTDALTEAATTAQSVLVMFTRLPSRSQLRARPDLDLRHILAIFATQCRPLRD
jgi:hypothetical protein